MKFLDAFLNLFKENSSVKKKYPIFSVNMIEPPNEPITTTEAKKIYKQFMKAIGFLKNEDISEYAYNFVDAIKYYEQELKDDCSDTKKEIAENKKRLKKLMMKTKTVKGNEKEKIEEEIEETEWDIKSSSEYLDERIIELANFKNDKREFLTEYINNETQEEE